MTYQKAEDFIGWISDDGNFEVIGIEGKVTGKATRFKFTCKVCSQDKELFPKGYFIAHKGNLLRGQKSCGCGKGIRWNKEQFLILARRKAKGRFTIHGFSEDFWGCKTKVNCECIIDHYKWVASIRSILSKSKACGCKLCRVKAIKKRIMIPYNTVMEQCRVICENNNYTLLGFVDGYEGVKSSVHYICGKHGLVKTSFDNLSRGKICRGCWSDKQKESGNMNGYYKDKIDTQDFLYILNFNNEYIKIGRSFNVGRRIPQLKRESLCSNISIIKIYSGKHSNIYELEQTLHQKLRDLGFEHRESKWSTETFDISCLPKVEELLTDKVLPCLQDVDLSVSLDLETNDWNNIGEFINELNN
ncbi:hypothetical protein KLEP7_gp135 [Pseudaeromonas phage vB_PpeM_ KLEP7]|nr:hypothetical protein KLEP7_gp135 [Pseudaeromonas phage vB_PpeM_ KLEP7]